MSDRPPWSLEDAAVWRSWWRSTPKDELIARPDRPLKGEYLSDTAAVFLALREALRGTGTVSPNPLVGCVILSSDGGFLSAGAHLLCGGPHAEIVALAGCELSELGGARVFVTLEPCSHHGRTPPCADALGKLPLKEVLYLTQDPNPEVSGKGAAQLKARGIKATELADFSDLGRELAEVFFHNKVKRAIFVGLKAATDAAGVYALKQSSRFWVTSQRAREYGHYLRLRYDAILVGAKTALLDDPLLNIRSSYVAGRTPLRVILDGKNAVAPSFSSLKMAADTEAQTLLVVGQPVTKSDTMGVLQLSADPSGQFDWNELMRALWGRGVRSLLIEGGGETWQNALSAGVVQKLHWFVRDEVCSNDAANQKLVDIPEPIRSRACDFRLGGDHYYEQNIVTVQHVLDRNGNHLS